MFDPFINIEDQPILSRRKLYDEYVLSFKKNSYIMVDNRITNIVHYIICNKSDTIENIDILKQQQELNIARSTTKNKHIDEFHCINIYDDNLNISITNTSTIFNVNLIINNLYINVFKKIKHNQNKLVHSILNNHIKFKGKSIDEICKMCEFIYENKDFIENLTKIKLYTITKFLNFTMGPNYTNVNINVGELNKLKEMLTLSNLNVDSERYINILDHDPLTFYSNSTFSYAKLTNISILDTKKEKTHLSCVINKENFNLVKNIPIVDICNKAMNTKYCTRLNNKLLISTENYNRLYNNNKYLNYYYDYKFTDLEFIKFNSKIKLYDGLTINSKFIYFNAHSYKKLPSNDPPIVQTKTLNSFINYKDNVCIVKKIRLNENYNSAMFDNQINEVKSMHQELIDLDENIKYINKKLNNQIDLITFIRYMIGNSSYSITSQTPQTIFNHPRNNRSQFINRLLLNKLNKAFDNIIFNIENKDKILNFINPIINSENNEILELFTLNIFKKGECPNLFKINNLIPVQDELSVIYLNKLNIVVKEGTDLAQMDTDELFINKLREMLILMNRKFTDSELSEIESNMKILRLKCL